MLVWYQPKANEVNFLPWLEHAIAHQRRKRTWLYSAVAATVLLGLAWFGVLYAGLQQAQADLQQQLSNSSVQLQLLQRSVWASSLERRHKQWLQAVERQRQFNAWMPMAQLSKLLMQLNTLSGLVSEPKLVSWQWQPANAAQLELQHQVVFTIAGQKPWQAWWQQALKVWPTMHMETLEPKAVGWHLKASYTLQPQTILKGTAALLIVENSHSISSPKTFDLQLTPPPYDGIRPNSVNSINRPAMEQSFSAMASQLEKYGQNVQMTRSQSVQANLKLGPSQWALLAPIPSADGWWLQGLSIDQAPSNQWQVSMQWLPHNEPSSNVVPVEPFSEAAQEASHTSTQSSIKRYANLFEVKNLEPQSDPPSKTSPKVVAKAFEFVGFSAQPGKVWVAWLRSLTDGSLVQVEVGHIVDGWRVSSVGAQGVSLTLGSQQMWLPRACLIGVCKL